MTDTSAPETGPIDTDAGEAQENESCPTCGATAGSPCKTYVGGVVIGVHPARLAMHRAFKKSKKK